jgi:hypothetical protein
MINIRKITFAQLSKLQKSFELDFDKTGYLRTLTPKNSNGVLIAKPIIPGQSLSKKCAENIAKLFLDQSMIKQLLDSKDFNLNLSETMSFAFGYRLTFKQTVTCDKTLLPIRGGAIHIAINPKGQIFSLSSTLQYGNILPLYQTAISKSKAIDLAAAHGKKAISSSKAELMFMLYQDQIQPVYEVVLGAQFPYRNYTYLVLANTGEIIEEFSQKFNCLDNNETEAIKAEALLSTPDPSLPISAQISKTVIQNLPNKRVLKNSYFEMFTGMCARTVRIKDDNTYCYGIREPEFGAVSVFLSLQKQIELYLSLGLRLPEQPMFVIVNDHLLSDNAYFDPQRYEIHIGIGSGVRHGGLTKNIAFDLGVANHEFGHAAVFLQVPGGDLSGKFGEAINEGIGDVLGALVMDYLGKIQIAKKAGKKLDAEFLKRDSRIIGQYALPPFGIRCQKNHKRFPDDWTGECHADGLIIGGALADFLVAMASAGNCLEKQLQLFTKLTLMALALLPGYDVTFNDLLRALITADKEICFAKYRPLLEDCFAKHGIILDTEIAINAPAYARSLAALN